jgi:flagellar biosynthesis protein FlhG
MASAPPLSVNTPTQLLRARGAVQAAPAPRSPSPTTPSIWAVGGGKGGVGKSVVASSLAVSFARCGRRVVLVDADLGAANLHTLFGETNTRATLNDFLQKRVENLWDLASPTSIARLALISGARALPGNANLPHAQKQKLIRHLRRIPADDVILDLSAGSAFNALDFFLAADHGVLVVVPEPTSVENAYHFLQAAFFRALRVAAQSPLVRKRVDEVLARSDSAAIRAPRRLIEEVAAEDVEAGASLARAAAAFRPSLITNKVRNSNPLAWEMRSNTRRYLGSDLRVLGELPMDDDVSAAIECKRPVLDFAPCGAFARALDGLVATHLYRRPAAERAPTRAVGLAPGQLVTLHREKQGKTRAEIAWHLRIREGMVGAIEEEDFSVMPDGPFLRSWLTECVKFLSIHNGERLVNRYMGRFHSFSGHQTAG